MRASVWFGIVLSLMLCVIAGCGGGLTAENKKLGEDYTAALKKAVAEKDKTKQTEILTKEVNPLADKVGKLPDDQKKIFTEQFKEIADLNKKILDSK